MHPNTRPAVFYRQQKNQKLRLHNGSSQMLAIMQRVSGADTLHCKSRNTPSNAGAGSKCAVIYEIVHDQCKTVMESSEYPLQQNSCWFMHVLHGKAVYSLVHACSAWFSLRMLLLQHCCELCKFTVHNYAYVQYIDCICRTYLQNSMLSKYFFFH